MEAIDYISLGGGGIKGFAYVGFVRALRSHPKYDALMGNLKGVVGTSIGSLFALVLVLDIDTAVLERVVTDFSCNTQKNMAPMLDIMHLINNFGLDDGEQLRVLVKKVLLSAGLSESLTFRDLFRLVRRELSCTVTNLTTKKTEFFSARTTPCMTVCEGICTSMSVPILFSPVQIDGCVYVDGALSENVPSMYCTERTLTVSFPSGERKEASMPSFFAFLFELLKFPVSLQKRSRSGQNIEITFPEHIEAAVDADYRKVPEPLLQQMVAVGFAFTLDHFEKSLFSTIGGVTAKVAEGLLFPQTSCADECESSECEPSQGI
jgi:predicted acylesterase/phospholipase RssA